MLLPDSKKEITIQLRHGEKIALSTLFRSHYKSLCFFARQLVHDDHLIGDILADAFMRLSQKSAEFDNLPDVRAFIYKTIHQGCSACTRKLPQADDPGTDVLVATDTPLGIDDEAVKADMLPVILQEVENLYPARRDIFRLIYFDDLSIFETATRLHTTVDTVRVQKAKAFLELRAAVLKENAILKKKIRKTSPDEWLELSSVHQRLYNDILYSDTFRDDVRKMQQYEADALWKKISYRVYAGHQEKQRTPILKRRSVAYIAAAAVILIISITAWFVFFSAGRADTIKASPVKQVNKGIKQDKKTILSPAEALGAILQVNERPSGAY